MTVRTYDDPEHADRQMTQHTPGPWKFEDEMVISHSGNICDPYARPTVDTEPDEMEANARLIAAAPEMLGVLRAIIEYLEEHEDWTREFFTENDPDTWESGWIEQARATIAKATGGTEQ